MGCRCSEISICNNDLSILGGAISPALSGASSGNQPVTPALGTGSQELGEAIFIESLAELQELLAKANQKQDENIPKLQGRLQGETAKVSSLLQAYISEDRAYHEEEARRAAE